MKKHPVDDLFKRKLEGLERMPSENAWLRIQEKQSASGRTARQRPVVWGWFAAAGVAAAVMGGYLVWQNQQGASPEAIQPQKTIAANQPARIDSAVAPVDNAKQSVEQLAVVEKLDNGPTGHAATGLASKVSEIRKAQVIQSQVVQAKIARYQKALPRTAPAETMRQEPAQDAPALAIIEKPAVSANAIQPVNIPVAQEVKILPDEPAVSRVNKPEPEPTRTIVVAVETGTDEVEDKPRNTRLARVFRQLKNARAGEKVDWDEVGFNPKNLVARVDDRLRGKDGKSSERDHPKEKTKL
ncbi:hypothetical protein [Dyadobacter sp. 676]|uniref:Uncharacterized protein n=1 Tax=Dyadobacter sp. 676 TaxID=3088362 RepID=A0AAU8FVB5_9BACT